MEYFTGYSDLLKDENQKKLMYIPSIVGPRKDNEIFQALKEDRCLVFQQSKFFVIL